MSATCRLRALLFGCLTVAGGCAKTLPELPPSTIAEPAAADVESVIFIIGDAGYADEARDPVLRRLAMDVELWSGLLARDSAVVVLFLGDIIYPRGMHPIGHPDFPRDSAIVQSQVNLLAGPSARQHGSLGYFLAGNHDWGDARSHAGVRILQNLEQFLDRRRMTGIAVRLQPEAGQPGPAVIDIGRRLRLLLFDTAWWMLADADYLKMRSMSQTEDAIRSGGDREIIVAAHHPNKSAASHGGLVPFWNTMGVRFLMHRSGAILQDLNSGPYRELREGLLNAFRSRPPLLFAGGHDHNLQVIAGDSAPHPRYTVVSGTGSKISNVGHVRGMLYRHAAPGYARVVTHKGGRVDLLVTAAPDEGYLRCSGGGQDLERCMTEGVQSMTTTFGMRLH